MSKSTEVTVRVKGGRATVTVTVEPARAKLKFGHGNAKLDEGVWTFSLPAGHACPFADACKSKADRESGRLTDGPNVEFRCYAATSEARARSVRKARWHNFELLRGKSKAAMVRLILSSLSQFAGVVRVHVSGDFFSQAYFDAWLEVARLRPETRFYAYTKALPFWVARKDELPENLVLTASYGGTHDSLIEEHGLRYAKVVFSEAEAVALGLPIDHDDRHAMRQGPSFALLIHGMQPQGTPAAKAVSALWSQGEYGYGRKADAHRANRVSLNVLD